MLGTGHPQALLCVCVMEWECGGGGVGKRYKWKQNVHCVLSCSLPFVFFSFFDSVLLLKPEFTDWLSSLSIHQSEDLFVCPHKT